MISERLPELIAGPELLNRETLYELRNLLARYPYFQTARLLYLKNLYLLHDSSFGDELRKAALYIVDRRVLFYLIEGDKYTLTPRQKRIAEELLAGDGQVDRTLSLIDAFLATVPEDEAGISTGAIAPLEAPTDYISYLLTKENQAPAGESGIAIAPKMRGQDLIDGFIEKAEIEHNIRLKPLNEPQDVSKENAVEEPKKEESIVPNDPFLDDPDEEDESYFTETLARIYIKQKRYSKALEIIKKLSLKYPKKNAYFADQISFLEKLIINAKSK